MAFTPTFRMIDPNHLAIEEAARIINMPHEPKAVAQTTNTILSVYHMYRRDLNTVHMPADSPIRHVCINQHTIRLIHQDICYWLTTEERGVYRKIAVEIGGQRLSHFQVESDMLKLSQRSIDVVSTLRFEHDIKEWYRDFQFIHPFTDGNGRVGGTIIAALSLVILGTIIVPEQ